MSKTYTLKNGDTYKIKAMIEKATTQAEQEKSETDVPEEDIQEASPIKK